MNSLLRRSWASFGVVLCLAGLALGQRDYSLRSPDGRVEVKVRAADRLTYDVLFNGKALLQNCSLSVNIDHIVLRTSPNVLSAKEGRVDQVLEPVVRQKFAKIRDNYRELRLKLQDGFAVAFRAYNEGAA